MKNKGVSLRNVILYFNVEVQLGWGYSFSVCHAHDNIKSLQGYVVYLNENQLTTRLTAYIYMDVGLPEYSTHWVLPCVHMTRLTKVGQWRENGTKACMAFGEYVCKIVIILVFLWKAKLSRIRCLNGKKTLITGERVTLAAGRVTSPRKLGYPAGRVTFPRELGYPAARVTFPRELGYPAGRVTSPRELGYPADPGWP